MSDATERVLAYLGATRSWTDPSDAQSPGDRYLTITAPVNEVVALFNAAAEDSFKAQVIQALSIVLGWATTEFERAQWPLDAQDTARRLVAATNAAGEAAGALASDLTDDAAAVFAAEVDRLTTASAAMRVALGLPMPGDPSPPPPPPSTGTEH